MQQCSPREKLPEKNDVPLELQGFGEGYNAHRTLLQSIPLNPWPKAES